MIINFLFKVIDVPETKPPGKYIISPLSAWATAALSVLSKIVELPC
jgi:hypothetical protein